MASNDPESFFCCCQTVGYEVIQIQLILPQNSAEEFIAFEQYALSLMPTIEIMLN